MSARDRSGTMTPGCGHGRHSMCNTCWTKREHGREPIRFENPKAEICCYCGLVTMSGIYTRMRYADGAPIYCSTKTK